MTDDPAVPITRARLADDLRRLGLAGGDIVMVHAAMSRVGPLLNGPDALIGALLDVVGTGGTLVAYTSWNSLDNDLLDKDGRVDAAWRAHVPGFDPSRFRAVHMNGVLAEFVRTTPGARRNGNPGASVAAIGRLAEWISADHPQDYGYGPGSPFAKLVEAAGRVLMVGAPWDTMTLIHHADHLAPCRTSRFSAMRCHSPARGASVANDRGLRHLRTDRSRPAEQLYRADRDGVCRHGRRETGFSR